MTVKHRIGGIVFYTISNVRLLPFEKSIFDMFVVDGEVGFDVIHRIKRLHVADFQDFMGRIGCEKCETKYVSKEIDRNKKQIIIRDFSRRKVEITYLFSNDGYYKERGFSYADYLVASNFRQLFSTFLPCFSAVMLHSSGVILENKAVLFLAPDNGGKSTVVSLSNGMPILSDDHVIIRKEGETIVAHGTPFGGITEGPICAEVGAAFVLEKDERFEIASVKPAEVLNCLLYDNCHYMFFLPKHLKKLYFDMLYTLCYEFPIYLMRFSKDYVDWEAIAYLVE